MRWRSNIIRPVTGTLAPVWLLAGVLLALADLRARFSGA